MMIKYIIKFLQCCFILKFLMYLLSQIIKYKQTFCRPGDPKTILYPLHALLFTLLNAWESNLSYLAAPWSMLSHCRGGDLTNPILILAFVTYSTLRLPVASVWGSRWPSDRISNKRSDYHRVSEASPSTVAQRWLWGSPVADKKIWVSVGFFLVGFLKFFFVFPFERSSAKLQILTYINISLVWLFIQSIYPM